MALTGKVAPQGYTATIRFVRALSARLAPYMPNYTEHEIAAAIDASAGVTAALKAAYSIAAAVDADAAATAAINVFVAHEIAAAVDAGAAATAAINVFVAHEIAAAVDAGAAATAALTVAGSFDGTINGLTPAVMNTLTTLTPTWMYVTDEVSGATELVSGVSNLIDVHSPSKQIYSATLGATVTRFDDISDSMDSIDAVGGDLEAVGGAIMWIGLGPFPWAQGIFAKVNGSGYGYRVTTTTGGSTSTTKTPLGLYYRSSAPMQSDSNPSVMLYVIDAIGTNSGLYGPGADYPFGIQMPGSVTNATPLAIGSSDSAASGIGHHGSLIIWKGAVAAALFGASTRLTVANALGWELPP